jgi:hypothetical protein
VGLSTLLVKVKIFSINNSMQKISKFSNWLAESAGPDPLRLIELGLWDGPALEWSITASWGTIYGEDNPALGYLYFIPNWQDLDNSYDYTIYPSSFGSPDELDQILRGFRLGETGQRDLIAWCSANLRTLIDKYPPWWNELWSGPVPARCTNTDHWQVVA